MSYLYKYGLIVGRFQIFHNGHRDMVQKALELCDKVVVYIGSSQAWGTKENPFSYYVRENMIKSVFETEVICKRLFIRGLPDIGAGNSDVWGKFVLDNFREEFHVNPNLYVTGCESNRSSWFNTNIAPTVDELKITRKNINISASQCRKLMLDNNYEEWCRNIPEELYNNYETYRKFLLKANNKEEVKKEDDIKLSER